MTPGLIQRTPVFACLAAFVCGAGLASDLEAYLRLPDSSFRWDSQGIKDVPGGRIHELQMVSQTWQRLEWEHELHVYEPGRIRYPDAMLLLVSGGRPRASSAVLGFQLAEGAGMRVAGLFLIPR
jgi:PhoPQ-activated pathogenicity-related protein